jgi:predicted nucleotidyltransferase
MPYLEEVREKLPQLRALCTKYRVKELSLFGSAVRSDFNSESDLDFLVDFLPNSGIGLFEFAGMEQDLEDLFGRKVDLIPKKGLKPLIKDNVLGEAHLLYAG